MQENERSKYLLVTSVGESEAASGAASEAARREASVAANGEASILASEAIRRDDNKAASAAYIGVAKREARGADGEAARGAAGEAARGAAGEAARISANEAVSRPHFTHYYRKPIPEIRIEMEQEYSEVRESIL